MTLLGRNALAQQSESWENQIFHFRSSHQFSINGGPTDSQWKVSNFNAITEEQTFSKVGAFADLRYSFHLHLLGPVGYFVGCSMSIETEKNSYNKKLSYARRYTLPGISSGLVYNISPKNRLLIGIDIQLERWDALSESTEEFADSDEINVNANAGTIHLSFDNFYSATWAIRVTYRKKYSQISTPNNSYAPLNADIENTSQSLGIGAVYHLL